MEKTAIPGMTRTELRAAVTALGLPAFRADQAWKWVHVRMATQWSAMSDLGAALRAQLAPRFLPAVAEPVETSGEPGGTVKALLKMGDGELVESVYIPAADRRTVCVSSQVGCRFRCSFCASGQAGFRRDLTAAEMVDQVRFACRHFGERVSHVVYMGMGEPFDNYENWIRSVRLLNDPDGLAIGARRITVSTAGVIPGIRRLAEEGLQVELSVSLHAPDAALRSRLMPMNRIHPLPALLAACADYTKRTKRIITFEYTLIRGVNDSPAQAQALARLLSAFPCRVNLIPLSPVAEFGQAGPEVGTVPIFEEALHRAGINATCRHSKGSEVNAACGQLRLRRLEKKETS